MVKSAPLPCSAESASFVASTGNLSASVEVLAVEIFNIRHRRAAVFSVTVS